MVSPTKRQNGRMFVRLGALTGVIATLTMDCLSVLVHRLGLTAPLTPNLIGRWFASILRQQPFHSNIALSPVIRNELAIGFVGHYAIGISLACFYIWVTTRLGRRPVHGPSGTRLFLSSLCSHACYGLGL